MKSPFERESGIVRIVGAPAERERMLLDSFRDKLRHQGELPYEREKTAEEMEAIETILRFAPQFVRSYGGSPVPGLDARNVHMIDPDRLSEAESQELSLADIGGLYDFGSQAAYVFADSRSKLVTAQRVAHEVLHFESFHSLNLARDAAGQERLTPRRIGFRAFDTDYRHRFFRDTDEAIIEELASRFDARYFDKIPSLVSDLEARQRMRAGVSRNPLDIAAVIAGERTGRWETVIEEWRYGKERRALRELIGKLYAAHLSEFQSEEEIFTMFAAAAMTGNLLPVARLVTKTLGQEAFSEIGEAAMIESPPA